jgi:hypothetical protein
MQGLVNATCISLILLMGTGLFSSLNDFVDRVFNRDEVVTQEEQEPAPALERFTLMTDKGPLDISKKGALFIYPDVGCRDALRAVKELPEEKRPYIIVNSGTLRQAKQEFKQIGLAGEYYFCDGKSPANTVPSLLIADEGAVKIYTCSAATDELFERKYPMLLSSIELKNPAGPGGHNAMLAAKSINDAVVNPGKEFSFYEYVGVASSRRGYLSSRSIMQTPDGPVYFPDVGGGICRTSTALHLAVKECSGLDVTERHSHSMPVSYAAPGEDAAVARSSGWDYRFVNNREKPIQIKIKAYAENASLRIEIWEIIAD